MKKVVTSEDIANGAADFTAGEGLLFSGTVYTARDAAHKRIAAAVESGGELPFPLKGAGIYYSGATPAPPGMPIGSCGPTTSGRMDVFTPLLLKHGLKAMIGKGERSKEVCEAVAEHGAVYFCALGGAGALAAECAESCEEIAYHDLGCEAVKKIVFKNFPLITAIDCRGGNIFANNK